MLSKITKEGQGLLTLTRTTKLIREQEYLGKTG